MADLFAAFKAGFAYSTEQRNGQTEGRTPEGAALHAIEIRDDFDAWCVDRCPHCGHPASEHSNAREDDFGCIVSGCHCWRHSANERGADRIMRALDRLAQRHIDPHAPALDAMADVLEVVADRLAVLETREPLTIPTEPPWPAEESL